MEEAIVLYPSPAIGHLISTVELAKFMLSRRPSLSIHVLLATVPYASAGSTAPYIAAVSASVPAIKFHRLPTPILPVSSKDVAHHETLTFHVLRLGNPHVHQSLLTISRDHTVQAFIIDLDCTPSLSVAAQLGIPTYYFFTSAAGCLAFFLYLSTLHQSTTRTFRELGRTPIDVPGIPPFPARHVPKPLLDRADEAYSYFLEFSETVASSSGILINTFEVLESRTIRTIREGLCMPNHPMPPLYCTGPLIAPEEQRGGPSNNSTSDDRVSECMRWLDSQPSNSVLFLCFGSLGLFSKPQLREIAVGLERSGQRFLWVVRNPPSGNKTVAQSGTAEPDDLESLLPKGFLDRTKDRGYVVKTWAPQVAVLNHDAVGGFMTHCGWNSIMEAVRAGVPMVAWPLYAEQKLNRALLVEEMKIGIPMEESEEEDGFVGWEEVERRARELMESEKGEQIRERSVAMREAAKAAVGEGGSSVANLDEFFASWKPETWR